MRKVLSESVLLFLIAPMLVELAMYALPKKWVKICGTEEVGWLFVCSLLKL